MRLTLIHNPYAGGGSGPSGDELTSRLRSAGHDVRYYETKHGHLGRALEEPSDLVVASGGDGTVAAVATRMAGGGTPLAILPMGGANNIAVSLGIEGGVADLLEALRPERGHSLRLVPWQVGVAHGPWGEARFVEAAGVGLFTAMLLDAESAGEEGAPTGKGAQVDARIAWGRRRLRELLDRAIVHHLHIDANGVDLSGEYLLAEAHNIQFAGPRVRLAPERPSDGHLTLVLVDEDSRASFASYLTEHTFEHTAPPPRLPIHPVRKVRMSWPPRAGRLDDEPWPTDARQTGSEERVEAPLVEIGISEGALDVLVPTNTSDALTRDA